MEVINEATNGIQFYNLKSGDVFLYREEVYIKCDEMMKVILDKSYNVNVITPEGDGCNIEDNEYVTPVHAKLVIENYFIIILNILDILTYRCYA